MLLTSLVLTVELLGYLKSVLFEPRSDPARTGRVPSRKRSRAGLSVEDRSVTFPLKLQDEVTMSSSAMV
ncbi:hypothetical protein RB195_005672 [Necator americanus]|uniref:Uncharacterized protein n=1 Tax=Necator americanus TaxID=51031 RepID=A0ABR1BS40_NECAM